MRAQLIPREADAPGPGLEARYDVRNLGRRLRELRRGKGVAISALAKRAGVPASTISKLETGQLRPSLVHAINLSLALETNLGFLVDRYRCAPTGRTIVRADAQDGICYPDMGLGIHDLNGHFVPGVLEARLVRVEQGAHSGRAPMRHPGEEFCHVLEGAIRYTIDGVHHELESGASIHFKSDLPHHWENGVRGPSVMLMVFSEGLSF